MPAAVLELFLQGGPGLPGEQQYLVDGPVHDLGDLHAGQLGIPLQDDHRPLLLRQRRQVGDDGRAGRPSETSVDELDPFTRLVAGMAVTELTGREVVCTEKELSRFVAPLGRS